MDTERAQFAVNSRRAPQGVRGRHLVNEGADLRVKWWTAILSVMRASRPPAAQPVAMPPDDRVRLHDNQRRPPVSPSSRESRPKESVARPEAASRRSVEGRQLLPQGQVFQNQFPMAAQRQRECVDDHDEQRQHAVIVAGVGAKFNSDEFADGQVTYGLPRQFPTLPGCLLDQSRASRRSGGDCNWKAMFGGLGNPSNENHVRIISRSACRTAIRGVATRVLGRMSPGAILRDSGSDEPSFTCAGCSSS